MVNERLSPLPCTLNLEEAKRHAQDRLNIVHCLMRHISHACKPSVSESFLAHLESYIVYAERNSQILVQPLFPVQLLQRNLSLL